MDSVDKCDPRHRGHIANGVGPAKDLRPISLTPIAAKVLETLVFKWVNASLDDKLDDKQFGRISGSSTTDALVEMTHRFYEGTDHDWNYARLLLLDYSKAFDLVNHNILIRKLLNIGIPSHIVRWLTAFLCNRTQRVTVGNVLSDESCPKGGIPQGTVTGPKNFNPCQ